MPLAPELVEKLVCPKTKQRLVYFAQDNFLLSPASRLKYRIDQGVPVLLTDEATELPQAEVDALVKRAKELGLSGA